MGRGLRVNSAKDLAGFSPETQKLLAEALGDPGAKPRKGVYQGIDEAEGLRQRLLAVRVALEQGTWVDRRVNRSDRVMNGNTYDTLLKLTDV